ncbi:MAG: glycosyltransferase family 39 protein [Nitrospira sp.]|nr:glycosyltransferase family 39 protein [Nitrospira sp.]
MCLEPGWGLRLRILAALVVATSHVFLWYGRRVLFDSTLTFLVTLALFAWIQVQLLGRNSRWYLLAFVSMALGAMLKEMHGFFCRLLVMALYAAIQRDTRMLKDRYFWAGLAVAVAMMGAYAQMLGPGYQHHFRIGKAIESTWNTGFIGKAGPATDGHPLYWYLGMMWADFFPWCAVLPSALLLLWAQRPFRAHPTELLLLVWVLGLFTAFSLATLKRGALSHDDRTRYRLDDRILLSSGARVRRGLRCDDAPAPYVAGCVGRDVRRRDVLWRSTASPPVAGVHCRGVSDVHRDDRFTGRLAPLCRASITRTPGTRHGRSPGDRLRCWW